MVDDLMNRVLPIGTPEKRVIEVLGNANHYHGIERNYQPNPVPETTEGEIGYLIWTTDGSFACGGPVRWLVLSFNEDKLVGWRIETTEPRAQK